ncbi:MAG: VWA domain-containing protein [Bdellovibrionota bacterium]
MRFFNPQALWLCLLAVVLPLLWAYFEKKSRLRLLKFASTALLERLVVGTSLRKKKLRLAFGVTSMLLAAAALARPQLGTREEVMQSQGLDMVFLLDVSNSMLAEDIVPNRLKKAKHMLKNFVDRLSGDRVGIVAFAGSAYPAVPLTTDYDFVKQMLEVLDETAVSNQGSNLEKALEVATELLLRGGMNDSTEEEGGANDSGNSSRIIVVLSDGEATDSGESEWLSRAKKLNIRVYAIGIGSMKGAPIPMRDQGGFLRGYKRDATGAMVHSRLETKNLESMASKLGGKFFVASSNEGEIEEIVGELGSMDRAIGENRRVIVYDEAFQYPLALAVVLLLMMVFLPEKNGTKAQVSVMAFLSLLFLQPVAARATNSISEFNHTKKGVEAYNDKDYSSAIQHFGKAQALHPDSPQQHLNLGDALLKSGSVEAAIPEFEQVLKSKDTNEAARGAYNLGKAFEAKKDYEGALRSYQKGLERLREDQENADPEIERRLKRALEVAQQQKQQQSQDQDRSKGDQGEGNPKDDEKEKQQKNYQIPKQKPKFQAEKLSEQDAKRILQQLREEEKKSQQRVLRNKTGRPKDDKNHKDW